MAGPRAHHAPTAAIQLLEQLHDEGLLTHALLTGLCNRTRAQSPQRVLRWREHLQTMRDDLLRSFCAPLQADWISVLRQTERSLHSSISHGATPLDALFGCVVQSTATLECKYGPSCWTPLCVFRHSGDVLLPRNTFEFFKELVLFLIAVGRRRCNLMAKAEVLTRGDLEASVTAVVDVTSPKSFVNRIDELISYVVLAAQLQHTAIARLAIKYAASLGFTTQASDVLDTFALGDGASLDQDEQQAIVLDALMPSKLIKRAEQIDNGNDTVRKTYLLSSLTGIKIGDSGRAQLIAELQKLAHCATKTEKDATVFDLLLARQLLDRNAYYSIGHKLGKNNAPTPGAAAWAQQVDQFLFQFLVQHSELNLIPANIYTFERECPIIEIHSLRALKRLVQTDKTRAEGGLRSCLEQLRDAPGIRGNHTATWLLRCLYSLSNVRAHHGVINIPLYLSVFARLFKNLLELPSLPRIQDEPKVSGTPAKKPHQSDIDAKNNQATMPPGTHGGPKMDAASDKKPTSTDNSTRTEISKTSQSDAANQANKKHSGVENAAPISASAIPKFSRATPATLASTVPVNAEPDHAAPIEPNASDADDRKLLQEIVLKITKKLQWDFEESELGPLIISSAAPLPTDAEEALMRGLGGIRL